MRTFASVSGIVLYAAIAGHAHGQSVGAHDLAPEDAASVELATTASLSPSTEDVSTSHVAETLAASLRLAPRVVLALDATLGFTSFRPRGRERRTSTRLGNPVVSGHFALLDQSEHRLELGVGAAPPLVTAPGGLDENSAAAFADRVALEARGTQSPWLWSNNAVPLVLLTRFESRLDRHFRVGLEVQPAYVLSVNRRASRFGLDGTARFGVPAGAWLPELALHAYAQSVPIRDGDFAQLSTAAALRYARPRWWLRGEVAVNLDGPAGFGETNRTPWGVTLAAGARF